MSRAFGRPLFALANCRPLLARRLQTAAATNKSGRQPVFLCIGGGAGIGQAAARKFSEEGFHSCIVRRGKGPHRLIDGDGNMDAFVQDIESSGGRCTSLFADGTDGESVKRLVEEIERDIGPIKVALYNIGAQVGNRTLEKTSYGIFQRALDMGVTGMFALAKEVAPHMTSRDGGTILVTNSTAAWRGNRGQHAHTAAMGARRNLCQSLSHELAPQGVHVCHFNIDAAVLSPETIGALMPEMFEKLKAKALPQEAIVLPEHVADTYFFISQQPRSSWTFEMDIRPWKETPWWNSS